MYVVSVAEMRAAEEAAAAAGITEDALQARAGAAVAEVAQRLCPSGSVVVLAGVGNNGRDGWVAARNLAARGRQVRLYLAPRHALSEAELTAFLAVGGAVLVHTGEETAAVLRAWLAEAALAIDALLGIGARGAARPPLSDLIALLNAAAADRRLRVLAVDVPSGIDADTGAVPGEAVRADATVVLGGVKRGLLRFPAAALIGVLYAGDIGLPAGVLASCPVQVLDRAAVRVEVPRRPPEAHKGTFGRVLVAGGCAAYYGAPYLAGAAAARVGCGLVAFAAAPALQAVLAGLVPEATYVPLPEGAPDRQAEAAAEAVVQALDSAQVLLIGPGLGRSEGARAFARRILLERAARRPALPVVVDADALYFLAQEPALWDQLGAGLILTPHHGEMARLTGEPPSAIAAEPWEVARAAAARWGQVVVLKGPFTAIGTPDARAWVLARPNPALATGGTGDVLAGTIAGLLAQGLSLPAAARVGVYVHAAAAEAVLAEAQCDLLLASDLLPALARELSTLRRERGDLQPAGWAPVDGRL
jgi:hydroxyethylthiazole kinase-like uncharacterized protein yjeF